MPYKPISDYGLIGDMHSAALVAKDGSIDWCCLPRFDGRAVFSRMLDEFKGGYFQMTARGVLETTRHYLPGTNVLETTFVTATGTAVLTDFMPVHHHAGHLGEPLEIGASQRIVRILHCRSGTVEYSMDCYPRFDYGTIIPHAKLSGLHGGIAHGGADAVSVYCSSSMEHCDDGFRSQGFLHEGQSVYAAVTYQNDFAHETEPLDNDELEHAYAVTVAFWQDWSSQCVEQGEFHDAVRRSVLTLKALTYAPSGALLAAVTTSLPELVGGERNWDYRFTWIRDATFALYALSITGFTEEAKAFKNWLEWSSVGRARDLQVMYGLGGERRLTEVELPELDGYRKSRPVRIGNGAYSQFQLDVYGEIMDSAHIFRKFGGAIDPEYWQYLRRVVSFVMDHWREPDEGIWETRGGRKHFVFSKVMCWVAMDRAVRAAIDLNLPGDVARWRQVRAEIREDIMENGWSPERNAFVQCYGSKSLDASVLMLPLVGFIKATDPKMESTIRAVQRELTSPQGYVYRYREFDDGLLGGEGAFTICTFWLADNLIMLGELEEARRLYDAAAGCANDLGLFSEEIDPENGEMLGNFPQAFSHLALINTGVQLHQATAHLPPPPARD